MLVLGVVCSGEKKPSGEIGSMTASFRVSFQGKTARPLGILAASVVSRAEQLSFSAENHTRPRMDAYRVKFLTTAGSGGG